MATISTMAIRIITQHAEAVSGLTAVAAATTSMVSKVVQSSSAVQAATATTNAATLAYQEAATSATQFAGKLLGVATASAAVGKAIRMSATPEMQSSYDSLAQAVDSAFKSFGDGLNKTAGLATVMDTLASGVRASIGFLNVLGQRIGSLVSIVAQFTPLVIALTIATKILTAALLFYVQYVITKWIIGQVTLLVLGHQMTAVQLAMAAGAWLMSAAYTAAAGACGLLSAALGILMAVGFPVWAALAIIAGVVLLLIGLVVAAVYGLIYAWRQWVNEDDKNKKILELDALQSKMRELSQSTGQMVDEVQKKIDQFGMNDMEKALDDFARKNAELRQLEGEGAFADRVEVYRRSLEKLEAMEAAQRRMDELGKRAKQDWEERTRLLQETVTMQTELNTKVEQLGWTDQQKALTEFVAKLDEANMLTEKQRDAAIAQFAATQQQLAAAERRLEIERTIAGLEQEAAQAGMTEAQKKLAALQTAGATAEQIAQAQAAINAKTAADDKKALMDRGKQMTESMATPAEKYKKQIEEINRLLAAGAISPDTAMRAADSAAAAAEQSFANSSGRNIASPQALLQGSAEAALAEDRHKNNPADKLNEIQRKALAELQKMHNVQKQMLAQNPKIVNIN